MCACERKRRRGECVCMHVRDWLDEIINERVSEQMTATDDLNVAVLN